MVKANIAYTAYPFLKEEVNAPKDDYGIILQSKLDAEASVFSISVNSCMITLPSSETKPKHKPICSIKLPFSSRRRMVL